MIHIIYLFLSYFPPIPNSHFCFYFLPNWIEIRMIHAFTGCKSLLQIILQIMGYAMIVDKQIVQQIVQLCTNELLKSF